MKMANPPAPFAPKSDPNEFWAQFNPDDFTTPRVSIGMGSPEKGKVGHFNFSSGESLAELKGVSFLGRTNGQILFGGMGKVPPRCASDDGLNPAARIENPITPTSSGGCRMCYAKEWGQDARKDAIQSSLGLSTPGERPACQSTIALLLADSGGLPFVMTVKTHNVSVVKKYLFTNLRMRSVAHRVPGYGVSFDLGLKGLQGRGNRYELVITNWNRLSNEEIESRANLWEIFGKRTAEIVSDQHKALDAEAKTARDEADDLMPWES